MTPLLFNKTLWETSGHWDHYRDNMFLVQGDSGDGDGGHPGDGAAPDGDRTGPRLNYALKAMNCPAHMLMFASEGRSYRDLPLRFHDQGALHRKEASGVVGGLTRVRQLSQDDAHCFITEDQIGEEVERLLRLVDRVYGDFGLEYALELSTRPDDYSAAPPRGTMRRRSSRRPSAPPGPASRSPRATAASTDRRSTCT